MAGAVDTSITMEAGSPRPGATSLPCGGRPDDRAAFLDWVGRLVHRFRRLLIRIARREGLGPEDAFDVVQEAFHTLITWPRASALLDEEDPSRKLLVALTRNLARNARRLHAHARPHLHDPALLEGLPGPSPTVEELIASAETQVRLAGCLRTLAEVPRAVVTLRMLDERPGDDVARALGISPGHVAVLLHRAKANLHACLTAPG